MAQDLLFGNAMHQGLRSVAHSPFFVLLLLSCGESSDESPVKYPDASSLSCESDSYLCNLGSVPLNVATSDAAYTICFVGDGFRDLAKYQKRVDAYVDGLTTSTDGFVAIAPELFSFQRLDLVSLTDAVNNTELQDTPLAAYLDSEIDACFGPMVKAEIRRVALAAASCPGADATIVIVNESAGRANASGGNVFMSSRDS